MIRTQISLDEASYRAAKTEARREGVSLAEFLRRAVAVRLQRPAQAQHPWLRYAGTLASGDPRASQSVDEVVYGRGRP